MRVWIGYEGTLGTPLGPKLGVGQPVAPRWPDSDADLIVEVPGAPGRLATVEILLSCLSECSVASGHLVMGQRAPDVAMDPICQSGGRRAKLRAP